MRQYSGKRDAFIERRRSLIFCIYFRYSRALNGHFSSKIFIEITKAVVQDSILRTVSGVLFTTVRDPPFKTRSPPNNKSVASSFAEINRTPN